MSKALILSEGKLIKNYIFLIRGQKVMLSPHLAEFYGVQPKVLIQAVKRNIKRFPDDFMFQLNDDEYKNLKSQFVTSSWGGARRANPYAFTEQGVAMLAGILNSNRAIEVNVAIMRAFVKLREMIATHKELAQGLSRLESKIAKHDEQIQTLFSIIRQLMTPPEKPKRQIGFHAT